MKNGKGIYRLLNILLLSGIGLWCFGNHFGIGGIDLALVCCAAGAVFLTVCFVQTDMKGRILMLVATGAVLLLAALAVGRENTFTFVQSYFRWLFNRSGWQIKWLGGYEIIQTILLVWICALLHWIAEKDFRIKAVLAAVLVGGLLLLLLQESEVPKAGVMLTLVYLAMVITEATQQYWSKVKKQTSQAYILWIAPFFAIYLLLLSFMPFSEEAYDWQAFRNIYGRLQETFLTISQDLMYGNGEEYQFSLSGFSPEGNLNGNVFGNNREVMTIQAKSGLRTNVYLTGRVFDTFDGRQWQQNNTETLEESYLDTIQTLYAVERYDRQYVRDYMSRVDLTIQYKNFRSSYLFAPLKSWSLEQEGKSLSHQSLGGSLLFGEIQGYGTQYLTIFYQMNADHPAFLEFLETETAPQPERLSTLLSSLNSRTGEELTLEDLEKHRQNVQMYYGETMEISEEVREYLDRITEGAGTDVKRLRAIEQELAAFTYTTSPGELPESITNAEIFLDYFLLESRQGYCNYFATAFVLLARAEGIPARYVQGFCVPVRGEEETIVSSDMAHAWPEVYLDDIGWIPFEPTPGYAAVRYTPWRVQNRSDSGSAATGPEGQKTGPEETQQEEQILQPDDQTTVAVWRFVQMAVTILGALILGFLVLFLGSRLVRRHIYRKQTLPGKYGIEMERNLRLLSLLGITRQENETLEELEQRTMVVLGRSKPLDFFMEYEAVLYGDRAVEPVMLHAVIEEQQVLLEKLKKEKSMAYFYMVLVK